MDTINKTKSVILTLFILIAVSGGINAELTFIDPTPPNGSEIYTNQTTINVLINTTDLASMIWNWNGTNTTFLNDSCVLHLSFDNNSEIGDSSTVAVDVSQYENNGSFVNGSTGNWTTDGKWNGAMSFDGVNDFIDCGNDPSLDITDVLTMEAWVKPHTLTGQHLIIDKYWDRYSIAYNEAAIEVSYRNQTGNLNIFLVDLANFTLNTDWHNIIAIIDSSGDVSVYADGKFLQSTPFVGTSIQSTVYPLEIGTYGNHWGDFFNGSIDEVRVYNRALSPEEVRQSYLSNLWKFNASQWYFESKQTDLPCGEHNYQAFANNVGSEYRILIISILRPTTLLEELNLICYGISNEISDINMSNYLVYAFILMSILLIILGIQIITNNIKR